jgi:hypothetical protein
MFKVPVPGGWQHRRLNTLYPGCPVRRGSRATIEMVLPRHARPVTGKSRPDSPDYTDVSFAEYVFIDLLRFAQTAVATSSICSMNEAVNVF